MISRQTKALIWIAASPIVAAIAAVIFIVVTLFLPGWGIGFRVFHTGGIIALLVVWVIVVISGVTSFRDDKMRNTRNS